MQKRNVEFVISDCADVLHNLSDNLLHSTRVLNIKQSDDELRSSVAVVDLVLRQAAEMLDNESNRLKREFATD